MIEVGVFAAKAAIIVIALAILIILIVMVSAKASHKSELEVIQQHKQFREMKSFLQNFLLDKAELKEELKKNKKRDKQEKKHKAQQKRIFFIKFKGDIKATQVDGLTHEINAIVQVATPNDEVVIEIESPGGVVHGYGLAASQILRLRDRNIPVTACVDKVAASGGYMMACVANRVIAAPFAIIGSIGVIAQVPNFNRLLKKHDVDYKEYTAGEYKRTVSLFGEVTPKGEQKFQEQLEDTHDLFKHFVTQFRPDIKLNEVATGEYWYGERAKRHGLIDDIMTCDEYLLKAFQVDTPIYQVKFQHKKALSEKVSDLLGHSTSKVLEAVSNQFGSNTSLKV